MDFKRITLMIKNNLGAITNSYKAKNPLKKKKIGNILLYGIITFFIPSLSISLSLFSIKLTDLTSPVRPSSPIKQTSFGI